MPDVGLLTIFATVEAVALLPISVAVTVHEPVFEGATKIPVVLVIDPQDADQVTSIVAENCNASLTITSGPVGSIANAEGPEPESVTVCGLPVPESANDKVALRVPLAVGLNTTLAVQVADAARLLPQVLLLMAKSPHFGQQ